MSGLILSDILTLKKVMRLYLLVTAMYAIIGLTSGGGVNMISFIVFFGVMIVLSSFSYNDMCHWGRYAATMPIGRTDFVIAKYILAIGMIAATAVIGIVFLVISGSILGRPVIEDIGVMGVVAAIGLVYILIMLPILFKFSVEKARIVLILLFLLPFAAGFLLSKVTALGNIAAFFKGLDGSLIILGGIAAIIILLCISLFLSIRIYKNKEF